MLLFFSNRYGHSGRLTGLLGSGARSMVIPSKYHVEIRGNYGLFLIFGFGPPYREKRELKQFFEFWD